MSNIDILSMCLRNLFKRKLRTILTMLGVVIGTVAIVVTVSLGLAVDLRFQQQIEGMGDATIVTVQNPANRFGGMTFMSGGMVTVIGDTQQNQPEFLDLDAEAVRMFENIPGVVAVAPTIETQLHFRSGNYGALWMNVIGVPPSAMSALAYNVEEGRLLQDGNNLEVVFGQRAEARFFELTGNMWWSERSWQAAMGEEVETLVDIWSDRINMSHNQNLVFNENQAQDLAFGETESTNLVRPLPVSVVGLLAETGNWSVDEGILMDINMVHRMRTEADAAQRQQQNQSVAMDDSFGWIDLRNNNAASTNFDFAYVRAADIDVVSEVHRQIEEMGFPASYNAQWLQPWREMARSNQQMLGAIGAVSLFVAAIGIANTMVMSTYERTREIGVMKVIGASISDIKKLFLIEAAMIGLFGGLLGVMFSYLASYILNNHSQVAFMGGMMDFVGEDGTVVSLITPWLSGVALLFAALIGLVSGYFPARRATRLSALNAIRTE